ncbi:hypothetical protein BXY75_0721 [Ulvibacter antarcticus]|uniref:Uncharacterized protein n=1 Tax=Ulvibacter antarcticus TaxID=442714 RepID=A0A3L9Z2D9_9FLAO|nr:hypothetical protein BXY75_0721 [Ulvibacter antarcticus]
MWEEQLAVYESLVSKWANIKSNKIAPNLFFSFKFLNSF